MSNFRQLNKLLGNIDLYLLDQILKGRFENKKTILDAGCGEGRNIVYLIRQGYDVFGIDREDSAINMLRYVVRGIDNNYNLAKFAVGTLDNLPYQEASFDSVISNAVLHFAENTEHFNTMFRELIRVLCPGGIIFIRMASKIGFKIEAKKADKYKYLLPDGSVRFLLTKKLLKEILEIYPLELLEPVKTVNVSDERLMTTLVMRKHSV